MWKETAKNQGTEESKLDVRKNGDIAKRRQTEANKENDLKKEFQEFQRAVRR